MFRQLHPNIRIRLYISFLSRVIGSMIFPFMAIYYSGIVGEARAGLLIMIQIIVQFIAGLYGGHFADILGRKKMMVLGESMKTIAFLGMLLVNSPVVSSVEITFLMMLLISISSGFINPAAEAMLIDVSTKETRAYMYSISYWTVNLSAMIGIMIGGWFFKNHFFSLLTGLFLMAVLTLLMTIFLIQETYIKSGREQITNGITSVFNTYKQVLKDIPYLLFTLGGVAILALEFQRDKFIGVRLDNEIVSEIVQVFNFTISYDGVKLLSLLCVENTLLIVLFTGLATKFIKNKPGELLMYTGFILFGTGFAVLAFSNNELILILAVVILTMGELLYVPTRQTKLADIVDNSKRGAYMAFNGFVFQFGKLFGALGLIAGGKIGGYWMAFLYIVFVFLGIGFTRAAISRHTNRSAVKIIKSPV